MDFFELTNIQPFSEDVYYINEEYIAKYAIKSKLGLSSTFSLKVTGTNSFKLNNASPLMPGEKREITISFKPILPGKSSFNLIMVDSRNKRHSVLEKTLLVKAKSITIEGEIAKELPASMKLGQKVEVIFLFTNTGNQTVTDVTIAIKQIEIV